MNDRISNARIQDTLWRMNVSQIYDGEGEPVEMKIELESKEAAKEAV